MYLTRTGIQSEQAIRIRAGGSAVTATVELLNSSPAGVGQLLTLAGAASSRTVTIGVGQSSSPSSPSSVTNGGVAFDPLLAGNIQVRATIPGFALVPESTQTVTVSAP